MAVASIGAGSGISGNRKFVAAAAASNASALGQDSYAPVPVPAPPGGEDEYRYPHETTKQKIESGLADVLSFLGHVPPLRWLGYKVLGLVQPVKDTPVISNLGQVDTNLYRGEQLGPKGFETLKKMGISTVINLEPESDTDRKYAAANGMKVVELPEAPIGEMPMSQGDAFLSAATDPANGKIYFHCYHGSDRTGAMAAIYQICVQGKSIDDAIAGMKQYGFHVGFEDSKIQFIYDYVKHWNSLSDTQKAQILHQPAPAATH